MHPRRSANQIIVELKRQNRSHPRASSWFALALLAALGTGGLAAAQMLPFERNRVENFDPRQSFAEGYDAWNRKDWPVVIERMQLVREQVPALADYALYYMADAERHNGDQTGAANNYLSLANEFPQSIFANRAELDYASVELGLGHPDLALRAATLVADRSEQPGLEQEARLLMARARAASNDFSGAYDEAQIVRRLAPAGPYDKAARKLAYAILAAHPGVADASSLGYRREEAALLIREGQSAAAMGLIRSALAMAPPKSVSAELFWLEAEAQRNDPAAARLALQDYLSLEPSGAHAAPALNALAHSWWRVDDTAQAREYFSRLIRQFPESSLAPQAMFEVGRTYEDDADYAAARSAFERLLARYPHLDIAGEGRFRAAFMLYMMRDYDSAASEFGASAARTEAPARDMFLYWQARSLEKNGESSDARPIYVRLAVSTESNYYPALAERRVGARPSAFPAALVAIPTAPAPSAVAGPAQFHLDRALALKAIGLNRLEAPELRALGPYLGSDSGLRNFVLGEYESAGAWYDGVVAATRLSERGELDPRVAERMRYPRGYWNEVSSAARLNQLDPYLVLALIRQESLFNPDARSVSDARGLMQLMPATAQKWAKQAGVAGDPLNLLDPDLSVRIGTIYLRGLFEMFHQDVFKAVAAYNGGENAVARWTEKHPGDDDEWVENIGYRETRDYVKKVIGGRREYGLLYQAGASR